MDDLNPLKVNNFGKLYNSKANVYKIIRQQWGTTLRMYDCIKKNADSEIEQLE